MSTVENAVPGVTSVVSFEEFGAAYHALTAPDGSRRWLCRLFADPISPSQIYLVDAKTSG